MLSACSSATDVSGVYIVSVSNGGNGCNYPNWPAGQTVYEVELDVTQSDSTISAAQNFSRFASLGIGTLSGRVTGTDATLSSTGTTSITQNSCAYVVKATVAFDLTGANITGRITYGNVTNGSPDCGMLDTCLSMQTLAGSRH